MELLLILFIAAVALILLDTAAQYGVDSRTGSADPRQPARGLFVR